MKKYTFYLGYRTSLGATWRIGNVKIGFVGFGNGEGLQTKTARLQNCTNDKTIDEIKKKCFSGRISNVNPQCGLSPLLRPTRSGENRRPRL